MKDLALGADFTDIKLHLDGLLGGGDFGEAINNLLSALGPMIWDLVWRPKTDRIFCGT